jgi:membrane peptidoglycan carboxypeptidase
VAGVWFGNDDFTPMKRVTSGSLPAEIWAAFMRGATEADDQFADELPQIAAFPSELRENSPEVQLASGVTTPKAAAARQQPSRKSTRVRRVERFEFLERRAAPRSKRRGLLGRLFR